MAARKRYREIAIILPIGGLILFMPPYLRIFSQPASVFGIPLMHVYIFGAWFIGILLTAALSRRLVRITAGRDGEEGGDRADAGAGAPPP